MTRVFAILMISTLLLGTVWAAPVTNEQRLQYEARIQAVKESANLQIKSILSKVESAPSEEQEKAQVQVMEIKRATEIERLQILLEWAQVEEDQAKIAEIESALGQWLAPEQNPVLPEIPAQKNLAPGQAPATSDRTSN